MSSPTDAPPPEAVSAPAETPAAAVPGPSLGARTLRVFVRPVRAWDGLEQRSQWWFPLVLLIVIQLAGVLVTYQHALLPMLRDQWAQAVADGRMQQAQADQAAAMMSGPVGMSLTLAAQVVFFSLYLLFGALVAWFGTGFVLGTRMSYRLSLEVVTWSSLVAIPDILIRFVVGWFQESMKPLHMGLGVLLDYSDPPTKLQTGLGVLLDVIGPFNIWFLVVAILGCAALSGAARKNVAWVLTALYLGLTAISALVAALLARGA